MIYENREKQGCENLPSDALIQERYVAPILNIFQTLAPVNATYYTSILCIFSGFRNRKMKRITYIGMDRYLKDRM